MSGFSAWHAQNYAIARVVQHECDHLVGVLYPMRVKDFRRFGYTDVLFPGADASQDE